MLTCLMLIHQTPIEFQDLNSRGFPLTDTMNRIGEICFLQQCVVLHTWFCVLRVHTCFQCFFSSCSFFFLCMVSQFFHATSWSGHFTEDVFVGMLQMLKESPVEFCLMHFHGLVELWKSTFIMMTMLVMMSMSQRTSFLQALRALLMLQLQHVHHFLFRVALHCLLLQTTQHADPVVAAAVAFSFVQGHLRP